LASSERTSLVELNGVTKAFGRRCVLSEISLELKRGEAVGIWGANGSGKSTLAKLIAGVTTPDHGSVQVEEDLGLQIS
jgi:ABC-type sugar transport system ATPase subunit